MQTFLTLQTAGYIWLSFKSTCTELDGHTLKMEYSHWKICPYDKLDNLMIVKNENYLFNKGF